MSARIERIERAIVELMHGRGRVNALNPACREIERRARERERREFAERTRAAGMFDALRRIRDARDHCAEHGVYPDGTLGPDQCFDDWAADVAGAAIGEGD